MEVSILAQGIAVIVDLAVAPVAGKTLEAPDHRLNLLVAAATRRIVDALLGVGTLSLALFHLGRRGVGTRRRVLDAFEVLVAPNKWQVIGLQHRVVDARVFANDPKSLRHGSFHPRRVPPPPGLVVVVRVHFEVRADPEPAADILRTIAERLENVGYEVRQTPWGYFNEFRMHVEGPSLAKVFKEI